MSDNAPANRRVIYIMSDRRSGSTLLENILSKSSETISVGELAMLNGHILKKGGGARWNWNCSCGQAVPECPFWKSILNNEKYFTPNTIPSTKIAWKYRQLSMALVAVFPFTTKWFLSTFNKSKKNNITVKTLGNIYNAVFELSGKNIIVDSSKDPDQVAAIYAAERNFDVEVIWLKKDLRAIAASKSKWREKNEQSKLSPFALLMIALFYKRVCYAVTKTIKKNNLLVLNYESLATQTQQELDRIIQQYNLMPYDAPTHFVVKGQHTIAGTPERFANNPIKYDDAWIKYYDSAKFSYRFGNVLNKI